VGTGLYVRSEVESTRPEQRAVEALSAVAGDGVLSGWAALYLLGAAYFDGVRRDGTPDPVRVIVGPGPGRRTPRGVVLSYEMTRPEEVIDVAGLPVVTPERALFDLLRGPPHDREAVVAADMALASALVRLGELRGYVAARSTWRRARWAATALEHASHRSRSPQETRLRLVWTLDAGLPTPLLNQPVFTTQGEFVCIADLLDPEAGLVVEFDGAEHRKGERHAKDVARTERIRDVGLEITSVTGRDIDQRRLVVHRLLSARSRALFLPEARRRWTLETPT
jgi:very-short-patch-repair endonuclease